MKLCTVCFIFLGLILVECGAHYANFKVYQVTPKSMDEARILKQFEDDENFDFWSELRLVNASVDIMVSPESQSDFEGILRISNIEHQIIIDDVEQVIEEESKKQRTRPRVSSGEVTFENFMRYDEIIAYLQRLAQDYPEIVTTEVIGKSFEGRDVYLIKISSGGSNKPMVFAEAAIHAREWIAPPVALYVIQQLVEIPSNSHMYQDIDWAIIPVSNPDGYEYTHTDFRLWRKTRTPGTICYGVDPNRNFDSNWNVIGASRWQCDETYAGYMPFSEPETRIIRDVTLRYRNNIALFLSIHSYGRWLLYPWGHTNDEPENTEELNELGRLFADAIFAVNGTQYVIGSTANALYFAAGTTIDWARSRAGIDLSYTIELPGGGFDIEIERIVPVVEETWEGFKAFQARLWRKTRTPGTICYGVDPNRNFDYYWRVVGASDWQCDQNYAGYKPFSEPETQIIRDTTIRFKDNIKLYLAIHSQGQWLLYPWGHITDEPDNTEELNQLGKLFRDAIYTVNGTEYVVGSTANTLYFAAGTSVDWATGVAGIDLSYTIELPGGGSAGHDIPEERIVPVVEETWEGFRAFHGYIQSKFVG